MTLGEILRDLLAELDITQKQLAESLNIGASTFGNYIQNNREPDYDTLKAIAGYFNVTTDYLLDHRTPPANNHKEDDILRVFRALNRDQQDLMLKQGKLLISHYGRKKNLPDKKIAEDKPEYKTNGAK